MEEQMEPTCVVWGKWRQCGDVAAELGVHSKALAEDLDRGSWRAGEIHDVTQATIRGTPVQRAHILDAGVNLGVGECWAYRTPHTGREAADYSNAAPLRADEIPTPKRAASRIRRTPAGVVASARDRVLQTELDFAVLEQRARIKRLAELAGTHNITRGKNQPFRRAWRELYTVFELRNDVSTMPEARCVLSEHMNRLDYICTWLEMGEDLYETACHLWGHLLTEHDRNATGVGISL